VVCDNYAAHKHPAVRGWLARHPRVQLHFTPTSPSWLNLVEVFFSIVERQALRRGDFASVTDLVTAISRFCTAWNERCQPFAWTKPADEIWLSSSVKPPQRRSTRSPVIAGLSLRV
jgi:transposase